MMKATDTRSLSSSLITDNDQDNDKHSMYLVRTTCTDQDKKQTFVVPNQDNIQSSGQRTDV